MHVIQTLAILSEQRTRTARLPMLSTAFHGEATHAGVYSDRFLRLFDTSVDIVTCWIRAWQSSVQLDGLVGPIRGRTHPAGLVL